MSSSWFRQAFKYLTVVQLTNGKDPQIDCQKQLFMLGFFFCLFFGTLEYQYLAVPRMAGSLLMQSPLHAALASLPKTPRI